MSSPVSKPYIQFAKRYLDEPYAPESLHGYSCQTMLARSVNELLHRDKYYCWFSKNLNSYDNGDDSNPLIIYYTVDRAVKQNGINHAKIKDIRANLMRAVSKELAKQERTQEIGPTWAVVAGAPLTWLRPEIWRLRLESIEGRYTGNHQYGDEFEIQDLANTEFDIIVE